MNREHTLKKIIIWMTAMNIGGAERSLIGLLESFNYSEVEVDLFLNRHEGELLKYIPKQVNLLPDNNLYASLTEPLINTVKQGHLLIALSRFVSRILIKLRCPKNSQLGGSTTYSHKYTKWLMPKIQQDVTYDLAISYITPHYFVSEKVNAVKKYAWIHQDYSKGVFDQKTNLRMWEPYDKIISISPDVTEGFNRCFPELKDKVLTIQNFLPVNYIRRLAEKYIELPYSDSSYNLLSIGRFCWEKNFESIPGICAIIRDKGIDCHWYIIGFGALEGKIRGAIDDNNMNEFVHIVGKIDNPYPYIKNCDLYVQPSLSEGKAVAVTEAQILGKPVVITDYPTSHSQLKDGFDGLIVSSDTKKCAEEIANILTDNAKLQYYHNNCLSCDYSGKENMALLLQSK